MDEDDSGNGASKALLAPLVSTSDLTVARSLADAAPGETLFINGRGQTLTPRHYALWKAAFWTVSVAGGLAVGITCGVLFTPFGGVIAGILTELLMLAMMRHWPAYRTAVAQLAGCQWEEAYSTLLALERKQLTPEQRAHVQLFLAELESLLGQPQQALDRLDRAQADRLAWKRPSLMVRCQVTATRAEAFATLGRFEEARRAGDELTRDVAAAWRSGRPRGDYLEMVVQAVQLKIAADADTPDALPDDDTLHRWARAALGRSRFGEILVSLAWAFHRRGDDDMARHLLAEAPSRIQRPSLPQTSPRLDAWAKDRARAWGIEG